MKKALGKSATETGRATSDVARMRACIDRLLNPRLETDCEIASEYATARMKKCTFFLARAWARS